MRTDTTLLRVRQRTAWMLALALAFVFLCATLTLFSAMGASVTGATTIGQGVEPAQIVANGTFTTFLPLIFKAPPVPQVVATVSLPGAQCPNVVEVNPFSGYVYVGNTDSGNVNILEGTTVLATVSTGNKPTAIASDLYSGRTYVTNLLGGNVSVFDGAAFQTNIYLGAGS
jgi:hypothetical protein